MPNETRKLGPEFKPSDQAIPEIKALDLGMPRPWRIALRLVQSQVQMIFDLEDPIIVGRAHPEKNYYPDIDLGAFNGGEQGVSREHLFIKLDGERVVIVDNHSANGTCLNGEWLSPDAAYPVRNGDEITLGLMKLQIELLTNPYN
ncbi:MAG TPA: FHA domain-containing protein [Phototrophicaceae bacterium]|nr:FHA domain-containing protein [Phototrophicaceae bacterium]